MSGRANKRLEAIALARNPYHAERFNAKFWKHDEWQRGFLGLPFRGYSTTIQFDVYNEGKAAFLALTKAPQ